MDIEKIIPEIATFVELRAGIKPQAVGNSMWARAIRKRMEATEISKGGDYLRKVTTNAAEFQMLVELIVVPETWFFRERPALDFMVALVKSQEDLGRKIPWRILSLACATGEEAYSIAMVLADAGIPLHRFSIEGVDISKAALELAKTGIYGSNSFRNKATLMHKSNFERQGERWSVNDKIRSRVKFSLENVISPQFTFNRRKYDVIFCRNLLIYFSPTVQLQVLDTCEKLLEESGVIVLGPAESEVARLSGFVPVGPRNACSFYRRPRGKATPKVLGKKSTSSTSMYQRKAVEAPVVAALDPQIELLNRAIELANEGHLKGSMDACQLYLKRYEPHAQIYFLLGALHVASNDDDKAAYYFEKAVYLIPTHYEALVNLALIADRKGDKARSQLFWRRARKQQSEIAASSNETEKS
ncbi:MAG: CheR family methyltransferase [Chlamydiales bacterium]|nr:CheR family methyltransferase [Chlamydiales bacterium]